MDPRSPGRGKVSGVNRVVAGALGLIWCCAGIAGVLLGAYKAVWAPVVLGVFACGYGALWLRVTIGGRLLTWSELAAPWRSQ